MSMELMMAVVDRRNASHVMKAARNAGAPGGTICYAKGTASSTLLAALGLGDSGKEVLRCFIPEELEEGIVAAARSTRAKGMLLIIPCMDKEEGMDTPWTLIEVISEEGFSEDIMAAARKAGAKGGTVINAHGTSTEADVKFFGVPLVPEKEILMIAIDSQKAQSVIDAINSLPVLKERGRAVMFTLPVKSFMNLG